MRQLVYYYKDFNKFKRWCKSNTIENSERLIIEINYPSGDKGRLKRILERLNSIFPDATISGMQSFGSFINHQISDLNEAPIFSIIELEKEQSIISHYLGFWRQKTYYPEEWIGRKMRLLRA